MVPEISNCQGDSSYSKRDNKTDLRQKAACVDLYE